MKMKFWSFQILSSMLVTLLAGCGQHYVLNDQRSEAEEKEIEYADFRQFPLPDMPDEEPTEKPAEKPPTPQPNPTPDKPLPTQKLIGAGTVYYIPVYGDTEKRKCEKNELAYVKDESDKVLALLCKNEITNCGLQGSCFFVNKEGVRLFAYKKTVEVKVPDSDKTVLQYRFRLNKEFDKCPQGMGGWMICLDPYRSIAADPKFHKMGDVVFIPLLVGKVLPNNETHDGYFVVRDTGHAIKGEGRFDFFIGFDNYKGHLFTSLKLNDKKNGPFEYYRVPEEVAAKVRLARAYPSVPKKVHEQASTSMLAVLGLNKNYAISSLDVEFFKDKWN